MDIQFTLSWLLAGNVLSFIVLLFFSGFMICVIAEDYLRIRFIQSLILMFALIALVTQGFNVYYGVIS